MTRGQLNAGHLGGRFLKRAFPQKVKPVPSYITEDDGVVDQSKQALPEVNRRSRTSAAMIGLAAISMGAHGLLLAHQGDEAIAAEPVSGEPTVATNPSTFDVAAVSSGDDVTSSSQSTGLSGGVLVEHTVQEGETLWKLAQFYGVDTVTVATVNGIPLDAVLRVGQVLKIPGDNRIASTITPEVDRPMPSYYGLVREIEPELSPASNEVRPDVELKAEQDAALDFLKQKREELRVSLSKMKATTQESTPTSTSPSVASPSEIPDIRLNSQTSEPSATHRVVAGETLSAIARAYGISQKELADANKLTNPNLILVSQVLVIPQRKASSSSEIGSASKSLTLPNLVAMAPKADKAVVPVITSDTRSDSLLISASPQFQQPTKSEFQAKIASVPPEPVAMGGESAEATVGSASLDSSASDLKVATSSFVDGSPIQAGAGTSSLKHNYVENLRLEIVRLREKYKNSGADPQFAARLNTKVAAVSLTSGTISIPEQDSPSINPEFSPARYTESLRSQVRRLQTKARARTVEASREAPSVSSLSPASSQLVATSSLGSENYEPLLPSSLGKMVSPDLPPLGSVDTYLPGNSGKFNGYIWPTKGVLTSGYGWRWGRMHKGIDIAAPTGTPILAAAPGVVITAGWNSGGYGNLVEIQHADGSVTLYAHNNRILVRQGQRVEQGQQIAEMGSTGYSTGPHCHFEVHLPGHGAVNPMAYLPRAGA
ncbi:peptidoglycan DD-metalloendopeptidase family protein [Leptothermofonsia sp. ETS-13]|uniref:peptidoglycan DD-metalloendopeptidase family protein n=1 Tax=Leptothermofonsia sp. ETS-13 TaxID=3035696 RepID=UPI003B9F683E